MPDENPDHDMRTYQAATPCAICGRNALNGCVSGWLPTWNTLTIAGTEYRYAMPCVNNAPPFLTTTPTPTPTPTRKRSTTR